MFEWQDWALTFGIVVFVVGVGLEASAGSAAGALLAAAPLIVCTYLFVARAQKRRLAELALPLSQPSTSTEEPSTPPANWPPPIPPVA
jgi:hypothetical protein